MNKKILARNEEIVIGVDVSDRRHNLAVTTQRGVVLKDLALPPTIEAWRTFLTERLVDCEVTVVYEAGPHGYNLHDAIRELGFEAAVVAPVKHVGVKTDARDARALARDWLAGRAVSVTVPDLGKRVRRQVLRARRQLI